MSYCHTLKGELRDQSSVALLMQAPEVRQQAASELANNLHEAYTVIYDATSSLSQIRARIEHTPAQVRTILGIA